MKKAVLAGLSLFAISLIANRTALAQDAGTVDISLPKKNPVRVQRDQAKQSAAQSNRSEQVQQSSSSDSVKKLIQNPNCKYLQSKAYAKLTEKKHTFKVRRKADFILVGKNQRKLILFKDGVPLKAYDVSLGFAPVGHKVKEADGKTPEGLYHINFKNPKSRFRLSLKISHPNERDIEMAERRGVKPGENIMIHGEPNSPRARAELERRQAANGGRYDWTYGCVAVKDWEMDEIYQLVDLKTDILICK